MAANQQKRSFFDRLRRKKEKKSVQIGSPTDIPQVNHNKPRRSWKRVLSFIGLGIACIGVGVALAAVIGLATFGGAALVGAGVGAATGIGLFAWGRNQINKRFPSLKVQKKQKAEAEAKAAFEHHVKLSRDINMKQGKALTQKVKTLERETSEMKKTLDGLDKQLRAADTSNEGLQTKLAKKSKELKQAKERIEALEAEAKAIPELRSTITDLRASLAQAESAYNAKSEELRVKVLAFEKDKKAFAKELTIIRNKYQSEERDFQVARNGFSQEVLQLRAQLSNLQGVEIANQDLVKALDTASQEMDALQASLRTVEQQRNDALGNLREMTAQKGGFEERVGRLQEQLRQAKEERNALSEQVGSDQEQYMQAATELSERHQRSARRVRELERSLSEAVESLTDAERMLDDSMATVKSLQDRLRLSEHQIQRLEEQVSTADSRYDELQQTRRALGTSLNAQTQRAEGASLEATRARDALATSEAALADARQTNLRLEEKLRLSVQSNTDQFAALEAEVAQSEKAALRLQRERDNALSRLQELEAHHQLAAFGEAAGSGSEDDSGFEEVTPERMRAIADRYREFDEPRALVDALKASGFTFVVKEAVGRTAAVLNEPDFFENTPLGSISLPFVFVPHAGEPPIFIEVKKNPSISTEVFSKQLFDTMQTAFEAIDQKHQGHFQTQVYRQAYYKAGSSKRDWILEKPENVYGNNVGISAVDRLSKAKHSKPDKLNAHWSTYFHQMMQEQLGHQGGRRPDQGPPERRPTLH